MSLRPSGHHPASSVVRVRCGRVDLPPFTAREPREGWSLPTLTAACLDYAEEHSASGSASGLAQSAWISVASPRLRRADIVARLDGVDWLRPAPEPAPDVIPL
ncbi:hypothetical protein V6K52_10100 [Knoellia sp. S7-12]|uniref:hypothetical protein n=1 Tax=Knoellia sp. S7-12 TaxID=3126698 RepID=UPI0033664BEB